MPTGEGRQLSIPPQLEGSVIEAGRERCARFPQKQPQPRQGVGSPACYPGEELLPQFSSLGFQSSVPPRSKSQEQFPVTTLCRMYGLVAAKN